MLLLALLAGAGWLWTPDKDRAQLEALYSRGPADFVTVLGVRVHVRDSGPLSRIRDSGPVDRIRDSGAVDRVRDSGPLNTVRDNGSGDIARNGRSTLVLLHGFGSSLHTWEPWATDLERDHRVIRYDLTSAGLTGADPSGDYSDERGLQILSALLDRLGVARATLIGHSLGGRLAWRFAAAFPERVDKLVLIAPDGFASPGFEYDKAPDVPRLARLVAHVLPKPLLRMSLEPAYADPTRIDAATVTRYHDMMLAPQVRTALLQRMGQVVLRDPLPPLRSIRAPTLLLWGEQDALIPIANAQDYLRALPDARLVSLPGVGHLPHEEAAAVALPPLRQFLAE